MQERLRICEKVALRKAETSSFRKFLVMNQPSFSPFKMSVKQWLRLLCTLQCIQRSVVKPARVVVP